MAPPPPAPWMQPPPAAPVNRAAETKGLEGIRRAALILAIGAILGFAAPLTLYYSSGYNIFNPPTSSTDAVALLNSAQVYFALGVVGVLISAVAYFFAFLGFRSLREVDYRFSTPSSLSIVAMVGFILVAGGLAAYIPALSLLSNCVGANPGNVQIACTSEINQAAADLLTGVALLGLGALIALIGWIGALIGFWRVGTRYNDTLPKIGAILLIFPYVAIVGAILLFVGASKAKKMVESQPTTGAPSIVAPPPMG
jgi:hypothetical protein